MGAKLAAAILGPLAGMLAAAGCSTDNSDAPSEPSPQDETGGSLAGYAESAELGESCDAALSAITYADNLLVRLGQEPYQGFGPAVRSRLSAVEGTLLNATDWPTADLTEQSSTVQSLAHDASRSGRTDQRIRALTAYRVESAELVLLCRDAAG